MRTDKPLTARQGVAVLNINNLTRPAWWNELHKFRAETMSHFCASSKPNTGLVIRLASFEWVDSYLRENASLTDTSLHRTKCAAAQKRGALVATAIQPIEMSLISSVRK